MMSVKDRENETTVFSRHRLLVNHRVSYRNVQALLKVLGESLCNMTIPSHLTKLFGGTPCNTAVPVTLSGSW